MSAIFFDLLIAVVLLVAVIRGCQKGLVLTLCGMLAVFVAFFGALVLSNTLAEPVSHAVRPVVEQSISAALEDALEEQGWTMEQPDPAGSQPETDIADQFSMDQLLELLQDNPLVSGFVQSVHEAVGQGVLEVTTSAAQALAAYIAREITRMVLFVIGFVLVLVAWTLLSRALDLACRLPVLYTVNRWAGGAAGLVRGGVVLFIACWLLRSVLPQQAVEQSVLLRWFCTTNPIALVVSFF